MGDKKTRQSNQPRGYGGGCASDLWVFGLRQAAGGQRRPCEVHLRHAGGGLLEPRLHGHSGAQRLRQGGTRMVVAVMARVT